ncbi:nickel ABC transporter permease [Paenibacillus alkalitolerans]|uniref:nickel ABC transporter permease n=1 Tax=Paenibacillus alkalitolerans TaxID=2799335 RepID=UPI001F305A96|nr:nickel ABC transporter permease [Paenibacillus alkalitolerans]
MFELIRGRLTQLIVVLFVLSLVTFTLMKLAPGDPVRAILKPDEFVVTESAEEELRKELGLDQPFLVQYGQWLSKVIRLDLGTSYLTGKPVSELIASRLPVTLQLAAGALAVILLIAFPLGVLAARYAGGWPDHISRLLALAGASVPSFWLGLLLIYFFAYKLKWLPSMGFGTVPQMILPSFALGFAFAAMYARILRAGLLESISQDYVLAARARGVPEWRIVTLHATRAALLPVITLIGLNIGTMLGGAVVIEVIFSWPGLGSMVMSAILGRDYPVIQGFVLFTGVVVALVNLAVDLSYRVIDPRIRYVTRQPKVVREGNTEATRQPKVVREGAKEGML